MDVITNWFRRNFTDQQVIILLALLALGLVVVLMFGRMMVPFFASLVIAYLLEGPVRSLGRLGLPRLAAVLLVFAIFMALLFVGFFWLVPMLIKQVTQLIQQLPSMISEAQAALMALPERYPRLISETQTQEIANTLRAEVVRQAQKLLTVSMASVLGLVTLLVYLVLMPILVFFFLKDKDRILHWMQGFLPQERTLVSTVWREVNSQIGNYIRGKILEILIVWIVSGVTFWLLNLNYAMLLGFLVGISVLIPYVGAAVVTLPVALVASFQWGFDQQFFYVLIAYAIIQLLDGNLLAPLLLSEAVNLHPIAIIAAILVFGGIWGFLGVFFAIPLATLINAIINAWPREALTN
ncbi:putative permease [Geoalkalibacter ferrihydriticus]|uniref:Permase n=2 Tax=Geoalkalibacter ferrihydriticus TaxID=392333 RepID=A0A0C2EDQ7_9BACT|nr:AI-2E family transporter [Geoalkalibacter ferrihydriticus]KIH76693.1 permase [Geoalkalibacter ferrihydriticus DSM 17813]SDL93596.1 putative permease [Geoalkalibacter ferrihydriticus]